MSQELAITLPSERQSAPSALCIPKETVVTFWLPGGAAGTERLCGAMLGPSHPLAELQGGQQGGAAAEKPGTWCFSSFPSLHLLFPLCSLSFPQCSLVLCGRGTQGSVGGSAPARLCHQIPTPCKPRECHLFRHTKSMLSYVPKPLNTRQAICLC